MNRLLKTLFIGLVPFFCRATMAVAQINDPAIKQDNIEPLQVTRPLVPYLVAGGALILALAVGFFPSKRATSASK